MSGITPLSINDYRITFVEWWRGVKHWHLTATWRVSGFGEGFPFSHLLLYVPQEGKDPDYSEYKEFKLTVENIGFKMLMKMGWKEGEGLGSEGQGIKNPVNK